MGEQVVKSVLLTNGSSHGQSILRALQSRDLAPDAIVIERARRDRLRELRRSLRKYGVWETAADVIAFIRRRVAVLGAAAAPFRYGDYAARVITVADLNSSETVEEIARLAPDLLLLGGCRILRRPVLATARMAVLNGHPGRLPDYRGVDVISWAIYNGERPSVTIHKVNEGVDTGEVISQRDLRWEPGDDIDTIRRKAELLAAEMMADAVAAVGREGRVKGLPQPSGAGKQYYRMPRALRREVNCKLKATWQSP